MLTELKIQSLLHGYYSGNCKYKCENLFLFANDWESDFFVQKHNKYSYEFEIKTSRQDFFADSKKIKKHSILKDGYYTSGDHEYPHTFRPNKFYYVVPENLVQVTEVPSYAGLIYINSFYSVVVVKEAPFIHKEKLDLRTALCDKFYNRWLNSKLEIRQLKQELQKFGNLK